MVDQSPIGLEYFLEEFRALSAAEFAAVCEEGTKILNTLLLSPQFFLQSDQIKMESINVLINYLPVYLHILKHIDTEFIQQASAIELSEDEKYERIKAQFMSMIQQLPTEILPILLERYKILSSHLQKQKKNKTETLEIDEDLLFKGLDTIVHRSQSLLNNELKTEMSLNQKVDYVFSQIQSEMARDLAPLCSLEIVKNLAQDFSEIFKDWAASKEAKLDARARSLITFLAQNYKEPLSEQGEDFDINLLLSPKKGLVFEYEKVKKYQMPLLLLIQIQQVMDNLLGSGKIDQTIYNAILHNQQTIETLLEYVQRFVETQDVVNRVSFAIRSLSECEAAQLHRSQSQKNTKTSK